MEPVKHVFKGTGCSLCRYMGYLLTIFRGEAQSQQQQSGDVIISILTYLFSFIVWPSLSVSHWIWVIRVVFRVFNYPGLGRKFGTQVTSLTGSHMYHITSARQVVGINRNSKSYHNMSYVMTIILYNHNSHSLFYQIMAVFRNTSVSYAIELLRALKWLGPVQMHWLSMPKFRSACTYASLNVYSTSVSARIVDNALFLQNKICILRIHVF